MQVRILHGGALNKLKELPDNSVHCCITSPPYWGLRDYGVEGQIGLEPTIEEYVAKITEVFREVRRVLRPEGTLWLNLGDTYNGGKGRSNYAFQTKRDSKTMNQKHSSICSIYGQTRPADMPQHGLKPKDLCMIPARVALALQADGWYLRSEITWCKTSPMPESVTDRPTNATEKIFMFTKSAKYFYDSEAARVSSVKGAAGSRFDVGKTGLHQMGRAQLGERKENGTRNLWNYWILGPEPFKDAHFAVFPTELVRRCVAAGTSEKGCCPACKSPWIRMVEKPDMKNRPTRKEAKQDGQRISSGFDGYPQSAGQAYQDWRDANPNTTVGWCPTCQCSGPELEIINSPIGNGSGPDPTILTGRKGMNRPRKEVEGVRPITRYEQREYAEQLKISAHREDMRQAAGPAFDHYLRTDRSGARPIPQELLESWIAKGWLCQVEIPEQAPSDPIPCTILDPFGGSGTTGLVAAKMERCAILIELNPEYGDMSMKRIRQELGMLAQVVTL